MNHDKHNFNSLGLSLRRGEEGGAPVYKCHSTKTQTASIISEGRPLKSRMLKCRHFYKILIWTHWKGGRGRTYINDNP